MESLSKSLGKLFAYLGGSLGAGFAVGAAMADSGFQSFAGGAAAFFLVLGAIGGLIWATSHKRLLKQYEERREQKMLSVCRTKMGRVTDVELAAETRYPLEDCRTFLKQMTESGSAEVNISSEGTMVYLFPGFLSEREKAAAQGISQWTPPSTKRVKTIGPDFELGGSESELSAGSPPRIETE